MNADRFTAGRILQQESDHEFLLGIRFNFTRELLRVLDSAERQQKNDNKYTVFCVTLKFHVSAHSPSQFWLRGLIRVRGTDFQIVDSDFGEYFHRDCVRDCSRRYGYLVDSSVWFDFHQVHREQSSDE